MIPSKFFDILSNILVLFLNFLRLLICSVFHSVEEIPQEKVLASGFSKARSDDPPQKTLNSERKNSGKDIAVPGSSHLQGETLEMPLPSFGVEGSGSSCDPLQTPKGKV